MAIIPAVYFIGLTAYWWWRHRCFDVCVYMSALYALTSLLAFFIVVFEKTEGGGIMCQGFEPELNFIPTVLYCSLLTLCLWPFSFINTKKIANITCSHPLLLYIFAWVLIAEAFLNFYLIADSTLDILNGDLNLLRESLYNGDVSPADLKLQAMSMPLRVFDYLNRTTILALPLFFYYSCVRRSSWWFCVLLLFSSLCGPLRSLQVADRAELVLYGQLFFLTIIFFRHFIRRGIKWLLWCLCTPVAAAALTYFVSVSDARFDKTDEGTSGSLLQYAGQGYLNFCYFYENMNTDGIYTVRVLPIINHVFFKNDYYDMRKEMSGHHGFYIGVFSTFLGAIMLDLGVTGVILWSLVFAIIALIMIQYYRRTSFDIVHILALFILGTVPIFGIFSYRLCNIQTALQYLCVVCLYILLKYKFKWS